MVSFTRNGGLKVKYELSPYELARMLTNEIDCNRAPKIESGAGSVDVTYCYMAIFSDIREYSLIIKTSSEVSIFPVKTLKHIEQHNKQITITTNKINIKIILDR